MTTQTILITGATAGIGRHAALHLARAGHHVIATGRTPADLADVVAASGGAITTVLLDVDRADSIARAAAEVDRATGGRGLDVLINNAGYATIGPLAELSDAHLRAQFETNVFGLMAVTRAFLPAMLARGRGRVLNVSSVSGRVPAPMMGAYHGTKYALEAMSDALRMELRPLGVDVVLIEPGTIRSKFLARTRRELANARPAATAYAPVYAQIDAIEARFMRLASGPEHVTRAIDRAIRARRPSARYVAPRRFLALVALSRIVPTAWYDAAARRVFRLDRLRPAAPPPEAEGTAGPAPRRDGRRAQPDATR